MTSPSAVALAGLIAWALSLLILMESLRGFLLLFKGVSVKAFTPDNANLSPFMQRLARAHANCVEGLPIFGGVLILALLTGQTELTDPLAYILLLARLVQSCIHVASTGVLAIYLRFAAFAVQLIIAAYWMVRLLWVI
ncbi:MAPEG family protein [Pseudomonas sp. BJa5]|uniref:MAPEG family protein n=1 Tax=Pseudomonas sp. BJa5 TaxID=2936270 RepID=UPI00255A10AE|nr:MAPEG family protein [Pseudomonas sp. BGr12]MDL2419592.1 MAPEG family protein [Pseudomonas sp. BGr12]